LVHGARLVLFPRRVPTADELKEVLVKTGVTTLWLTSSLFNYVIDQLPDALTTVRHVLTGGEALSVSHIRRAQTLLANTTFTNGYGPTENTTFTTCYRIPAPLETEVTSLPLGRAIANTTVYILDAYLQPVPVGVPGELYAGGDGLARGYAGHPDLTAAKFIRNPFSADPAARLYATGDRARYLPDGNIQYLGRFDDQVKIRGFRIEPGEIEAALALHPAIQGCAVIVREDEPGDRRLVAYCVARQGSKISIAELRDWLRGRLPEYMIPSAFIALGAIPLTPNGKLDRRALPALEVAGFEDAEGYVAPRNPIEELVCDIWADVLKLDRVSATSNFFECGGHSLRATQAISRIRQTFLVDVPLRAIFDHPTVAGIAELVGEAQRAGSGLAAPPIVRISRDQAVPLSFAQQRLWVLDQLEPGNALYNVPLTVRMTGSLNISALEEALNGIVRRHEILRTTYSGEGQQPVQVIAPELRIPLQVQDAAGGTSKEREQDARRLLMEAAGMPFDLGQGPVIRTLLVRVDEEDHVLLVNIHHIATDGWSISILTRELAVLYSSALEGQGSPLPSLPIQYSDYAVWQRSWLQGEQLARQVDYWKSRLAGAPPQLMLPTDRQRPAVQTFRGASHNFLLPNTLAERIRSLTRRQGATMFMTMLSGFQILLRYWTRQTDIVLGTDLANRTNLQTESLIGFFVNLLATRADLSGDPSFEELLAGIREHSLEDFAHQDLPFDKLVEELQPERNPAFNPLVQALFVQQNTPRNTAKMPGIELSGFKLNLSSKFDCALFVAENTEGISGNWVYNPDLFDESTISRMASLYGVVLDRIAEDPSIKLSALMATLAESEHQLRAAGHDVFEQASSQKLRAAKRSRAQIASQEGGVSQ
jgi:non-ribosomal peptide synthetase component F